MSAARIKSRIEDVTSEAFIAKRVYLMRTEKVQAERRSRIEQAVGGGCGCGYSSTVSLANCYFAFLRISVQLRFSEPQSGRSFHPLQRPRPVAPRESSVW